MAQESTRNNEQQPPWEEGSAQPEQAFGAWLRQQREVREVGLEEVAEATKIGTRYLHALESGQFALLPAAVFTRGFLREYARYVGLNPDEVVNSYITAVGGDGRDTSADEESSQGSVLRLGLLLLALLVVLAFAIWWLADDEGAPALRSRESVEDDRTVQHSVPTSPQLPTQAAADRSPQAPLVLTLDFSGRTWVEAVVDGEPAISQEHVQGESLRIPAREQIVLSLSNPSVVEVLVNGQSRELQLGPSGEAVEWVIQAPQLSATSPGDSAP